MAHTAQRVLCLPQGAERTAAAVVPVEGVVRPGHGIQKPLRIAEHAPPRRQLLLLAGLQLRPIQLLDLVLQRVHAAGFFRLVHLQRAYLPPYICKVSILFSIRIYKGFRLSEAVQIYNMLLLVQKLLPVVLPMDIQQPRAQRPQLRHRHRPPVDTAHVFAVCLYLPLQKQGAVRLRLYAQCLRQPRLHAGKRRADKGLVRPGADQLPAGALSQHGAETVDHNGLARARLAGQGVEPRRELDVCRLDDGDILNMQQLQHTASLLSAASAAPVHRNPPRARCRGTPTAPCRRPPACPRCPYPPCCPARRPQHWPCRSWS